MGEPVQELEDVERILKQDRLNTAHNNLVKAAIRLENMVSENRRVQNLFHVERNPEPSFPEVFTADERRYQLEDFAVKLGAILKIDKESLGKMYDKYTQDSELNLYRKTHDFLVTEYPKAFSLEGVKTDPSPESYENYYQVQALTIMLATEAGIKTKSHLNETLSLVNSTDQWGVTEEEYAEKQEVFQQYFDHLQQAGNQIDPDVKMDTANNSGRVRKFFSSVAGKFLKSA
jgi:hypothetical protein